MSVLAINEFFGPTIQGEGPAAGAPSYFLRLAGCNVGCAWCDTRYAWDWESYDVRAEMNTMAVDDVICMVLGQESVCKRLVVTGGEPMLQAKALVELCGEITPQWRVEIETAGAVMPPPGINASYVVSPKLANAKARVEASLDVLRVYAEMGAAFKFVCGNVTDVREAYSLAVQARARRVFYMPLGVTPQAQATVGREIVDEVIRCGGMLSLRQHVLLWGDERGR